MHGTTKALQQQATWLILITLFLISAICFSCEYMKRVKKNYTDLHRRVTALETKMKGIK